MPQCYPKETSFERSDFGGLGRLFETVLIVETSFRPTRNWPEGEKRATTLRPLLSGHPRDFQK